MFKKEFLKSEHFEILKNTACDNIEGKCGTSFIAVG